MSEGPDLERFYRQIPGGESESSPGIRLARAGQMAFGIGAAATPLLLWMTWSETSYYMVILWGVFCCVGFYWVSRFLPEHRNERPRARRRPPPRPQ